MANRHAPYHPVIYVRGFAGTQGEIEETVADPYMGFNIGSTKSRRVWDGTMRRFFFESPLVRLKDEIVWTTTAKGRVRSDRRYDDVYVDGEDLTAPNPEAATEPLRRDITIPYQSIVIFRYYDDASTDFGTGTSHAIEHFARNLSNLILRLRTLVCQKGGHDPITGDPLDNDVAPEDFRVYLVAHSMGGLVARAFLQNPELGDPVARRAVDKVFTYATPHNGIDLRVVRNVPGWAALGETTNFNRDRMLEYLALPAGGEHVAEVRNFPAERIFNLVGTNPADYLVLRGLSSWAVGEVSDGLVRIENATTYAVDADTGTVVQSPRAFAHRSHSGHYGIVNSEEGYQNLTRFLFGAVRVDGILDIDRVTLPREVQQELDRRRKVRASYKFEIVAAVRGAQWQVHRRTVRENSAIQRTFDELFPEDSTGARHPNRERSPHLFSVFLDPRKSLAKKKSVAFAFDLAALVPDYEVQGVLWLNRHFEGGYIYRDLIVVEATPAPASPGGWRLTYGYQSQTPNTANKKTDVTELRGGGLTFSIPVESKKGDPSLTGTLRIELRPWA